jgi:hypothetical protein
MKNRAKRSGVRGRCALAAHLVRFTLLGAVFAPAPAAAQVRGDDPLGALHYVHDLRSYPLDRLPPQARQAALAQMKLRWPQTAANRTGLSFGVGNSQTTWTQLGPSPETNGSQASSGRVNSIAIDPTAPQTIYIGAAQGGVWKTTNGGTSWAPLTDGQCSLAMGAVVLDPVNPQIVYAGTGEQNFSGDSYYGCGVLRSSDGGNTWTQHLGAATFNSSSGGTPFARILVDKSTAGSLTSTVLLAATEAGLYRSANSGMGWSLVLPGIATDIVADPTTPTTIFAAVGSPFTSFETADNGVFKSLDAGGTWTRLAGGLPASGTGRINIAISPSNPTVLYAAIQDPVTFGALLGIWTTQDAGVTWTKTAAASASCGSNNQCWYDMFVAVDPSTPTTVYFGGVDLYKSVDGAATFVDITSPIHVDQHFFLFDPVTAGTVYAGNDGGVWKSTDAGATWTSLNTNLSITQFYHGVTVSPTSTTTILGGSQDNGTMQWGGAASWPVVLGGDGGATAIDQITGITTFANFQWIQNNASTGPYRRDAASGSGFASKNSGIAVSDRAMFIAPMVMDIVRPRILYFGTQHVYRTANSGDAWVSISPDLSKGTGAVNAIFPAASDSMTIYAGTNDGNVQVTHNLGATWTLATGLPLAAVTALAVDPHDARTAYVTFSSFTTSKVFRTVDGGLTWTDLTFNLPAIPVNAIVLEPGTRDLDIGTDIGMFKLPNGATQWTPFTNGLPNVAVFDLVFDYARNRLIAATHGRGMFSLDVTVTGLRGDITNNNKIDVLDAQAILSAVVGLPIPGGSIRYPNGDANCDGQVTALDALIVLSMVAGLNVSAFCVGTIK